MIVIDPGHGGSDPGAPGPCGAEEKDVVLAIAHRLHDLLPGSILTRDDDTFISLSERAAFANRAGADLFVSIHANAHETAGPEGIETFHHPASAEAGELATEVQASLTAAFPDHKNRGIKTARFAVLERTAMPAILVETEFISNPKWCSWLTTETVQARYAHAVARGIRSYLNEPEVQPGDVYRVTVDGKRMGAFAQPANAVKEVIKERPDKIVIERT